MSRLSFRPLVARYAVATTFLLLVAAGDGVTALLAPRQAAALRLWASTNVANLHYHPIAALVLSAFLVSESSVAWLVLIALAMFGVNKVLGNLRLALVCTAGHMIGTAVSEGIVAYRVYHGDLPSSFAHIVDIGPSYVVVAAIVAAAIFGSWPARGGAVMAFATLVFVGHIFGGLTSLNVAAVGHLTAMVTAAVLTVTLRRAPGVAQPGVTYGSPAVAPAEATRASPAIAPADATRAIPGVISWGGTAWAPQTSQDAAQANPEQSSDPAD